MQVTVLDVGQGQCIVVTSDNMTAVIDCGSTSKKYAGEIAEKKYTAYAATAERIADCIPDALSEIISGK